MRKHWVILLMLLTITMAAQESKQNKAVEASTEVLQKANRKVQQRLGRLEKKLTKAFTPPRPHLR